VRKGTLAFGLGMTIVGGYLFAISMIMINDISFDFDWTEWTLYLTFGIILVSLGPGVIAWAFASSLRTAHGQTQWQTIHLPKECPECKHTLEVHSIEWIGPDEARCPFCSQELEIRKS
jgi:hypothetical protein